MQNKTAQTSSKTHMYQGSVYYNSINIYNKLPDDLAE